jgi:predicted AlkP superfamily phosphohydrolase/phosphomutase
LNRQGRERQGILSEQEAEELARRLQRRLTALTDPDTGRRPFSNVVRREQVYRGPYADLAPDLVLGCRRGYRTFDPAGQVRPEVFGVNRMPWSGTHLIDPAAVPGVLLCNRAVRAHEAALEDLGPTICRALGAPVGDMEGRDIFGPA